MIKKDIRAINIGFGEMGRVMVRYMYERGVEIVGAFNRRSNIGDDIGTLAGLDKELGVGVRSTDELDEALKELKPDICLVSTSTLMKDQRDILLACANNGINTITIAEEALYPWDSSPDIASEIDEAAKLHNCTVTGSGYPDIYWGVLVNTIAGSVHRIDSIVGESSYGVNGCGKTLADEHGCGLTVEEFEKEFCECNSMSSDEIREAILKDRIVPSFMWYQNGWLCSRLGLTPTSQTQECSPIILEEEVYLEAYDKMIPPGYSTGLKAVVRTETEEGITIESTNIGYTDYPREGGVSRWTIQGEPDTKVAVTEVDDIALTCAPPVNRIPDVIAAPAGFITTDNLPDPKFWR